MAMITTTPINDSSTSTSTVLPRLIPLKTTRWRILLSIALITDAAAWSRPSVTYRRLPSPLSAVNNKVYYPPPLEADDLNLLKSVGGPRAATYGEVTPIGFRSLAQRVGLSPTDSFVDLGSGAGTLVLQASREFGVKRSSGIELAKARHMLAMSFLAALSSPSSSSSSPPPSSSSSCDNNSNVHFVLGDAAGPLAADLLQDATVVWCSNLLFNDELQQRIADRIADSLTVNAVASLKPFPDGIRGFDLEEWPCFANMSWDGTPQPGHPPMPGHQCPIYVRVRQT
jgi:hypothetical protein